MRRFRAALIRVLALAAATWVSLPAGGTIHLPVSDTDLLRAATAVVEATVIDSSPAELAGRPATDYRIAVDRLLGGSDIGSDAVIRVLGGETSDGVGLYVPGASRFRLGDRVLLFLETRGDGTFGVLHMSLGAFHRVDVPAGRPLAYRSTQGMHEIVPLGHEVDPRRNRLRDYEAFVDWIADSLAGIGRPAEYFLDSEVETAGAWAQKYLFFQPS